MITTLSPMPEGTLGFRASGRITAEDYTTVLEPALRSAVEAGQPIRLLFQLADDVDYSTGAAWQDLKTGATLGLPHLSAWERTAIVSDADWVQRMSQALGWMMPGELRSYPSAEIEDAKAWLTGD
jgi:hypothetical protein